jgi:hypothetical protein
MTDHGTHLMDVVQWMTNSGPPRSAVCQGHQQNFLDCIRTRQEPNCPIEVAAEAVAGPHMANLAYREDRKVKA